MAESSDDSADSYFRNMEMEEVNEEEEREGNERPGSNEINEENERNGSNERNEGNEENKNETREEYISSSVGVYSLKNKKMGKCVILNHKYFAVAKLGPRYGTDKDVNALKNFFERYKFEVEVHNDKTFQEIKEILNREADDESHKDANCFALCVLTHGNLNKERNKEILWAYDECYLSEVIFSPFVNKRCPSLANKPKLFFIQACRGSDYEDVSTPRSYLFAVPTTLAVYDPLSCCSPIASHVDYLIAYSTMRGNSSWESHRGSYFIQYLCETLNEKAESLDLQSILTIVCRKVSDKENQLADHMKKQNQVPTVSTTLRRRFLFTRNFQEEDSSYTNIIVTLLRYFFFGFPRN